MLRTAATVFTARITLMSKQALHQAAKRLYLGLREQSRNLSAISERGKSAVTFAEREVDSWPLDSSLSFQQWLELWRHGFLSEDGLAYEFSHDDREQYLSHYEQVKAGSINGEWSVVNANKLVFHRMLEPFKEHRSKVFGRITGGRFIPMDDVSSTEADGGHNQGVLKQTPDTSSTHAVALSVEQTSASEWIGEYLRREGWLVLKPTTGGMGKEVLICMWTGDSFDVNRESMTATEFEALVADLDGYMVCEFVEQATYSAELFADAANTLRVITMWDHERGEAFIPIATHRIGTEQSAPVDNGTQGGLSAEIDLETGVLSQAIQPLSIEEKEWYATHPETGGTN